MDINLPEKCPLQQMRGKPLKGEDLQGPNSVVASEEFGEESLKEEKQKGFFGPCIGLL